MLLLHPYLPLGVTNEENYFSTIKQRFLASLTIPVNYSPSITRFLAPLPGTRVYKIGELHTIFYLCFLVLLVYLLVFALVSFIRNTKKISYIARCCYYGFH